MSEVFTDCESMSQRRLDFQRGLLSAVYGVKACVNAVREDFKSLRMKPQSAPVIRAAIEKKRGEIEELIGQMREMFGGVARELRAEAAKERAEMAEMRGEIQEAMGFED